MAENQVNEILELDTTLKVGNNTYNINAEKAGQVENSLKITEVITGEETTANKEFNGSTPVDISVVPSTGGTFTGAINVPDTSEVQPTSVLNYNDILNKVLTEISNHSTVYEWEAEEDAFDRGDLIAKLEGAAPSGICVVIGAEKDRLVFGRYNEKNKVLPAYLYICSDSGNIYYCTYDDYIKLAAESDSARKLNYYGNQTTPDTPSISYTAEDLKNKFDEVDSRITHPTYSSNTIGENIYNVLASGGTGFANKPLVTVRQADAATMLIEYKDDGYSRTTLRISDITDFMSYVNDLLGELYDKEESTINSAKTADTATKDSAGNTISTYYQPKILTGTADPNSTNAPTAVKNAPNGAIYIKYLNK